MTNNWTHDLPMRWADIDMLHHVNNVTYIEYAAEAQALLARDGHLREDAPTEIVVTFLSPVLLSHNPVRVTSKLDEDVLTQEVFGDSADTVAARIVSRWTATDPVHIPDGAVGALGMRVRVGDIDGKGHVTVPKLFELSQESRIRLISLELNGDSFGKFVVGTVDVRIHDQISWRAEPYDLRGWVSRVGQGSFTINTVLADGDRPLVSSSSVLVGFDLESQRSRKFSDDERAAMSELLCE